MGFVAGIWWPLILHFGGLFLGGFLMSLSEEKSSMKSANDEPLPEQHTQTPPDEIERICRQLDSLKEPLPQTDLWSDSTEGKTQEALRLVCLIRGREPAGDSAEGQAQVALSLWRSGQREQALDHFNRAVELAPDDAVILINRANLKHELGSLEDAMEDFERAQRGIAQRGYPKLPEYFFAGLELWRKMPPEERQAWIERRRNVNITAW
jgi:tetratricopeptide (TPR) repeat protein